MLGFILSVVEHVSDSDNPAPTIEREAGIGPAVLVCDHATNHIPPVFGALGLAAGLRDSHVVWDPGALDLARRLSARLDAPLIYPGVSRLVIDCNRDIDAPDSIVRVSEAISVPGNLDISPRERARRKQAYYDPFHHTLDTHLARRRERHIATALIAIHTFTPVFHGKARPWHAGVIFDAGNRLAEAASDALAADPDLCIGRNQPYAPDDGVYFTVSRHTGRHGIAGLMLEIRNDLLRDNAGLDDWADRLTDVLSASLAEGR